MLPIFFGLLQTITLARALHGVHATAWSPAKWPRWKWRPQSGLVVAATFVPEAQVATHDKKGSTNDSALVEEYLSLVPHLLLHVWFEPCERPIAQITREHQKL